MAGRGGKRAGAGKRVGQFNRASLEAELLAAKQQLAQYESRQSKGHKLAIEVLNDLMHVAYGMMAKHQPLAAGEVPAVGRIPNPAEFKEWMKITREAAGELAPFQSSKFKSVSLSVEQPPGGNGNMVPENPGAVRAMTPQEAYRMLRDSSELIELRPNAPTPAGKVAVLKPKKQARG